MDCQKFWGLFPFGTHLCRAPMPPMTEMKRDMELMKKHGFNLIKLQENWMLDEPREGVYDFSAYHELISHAQKLDMGIYLGLTCEQAPNWLWEKYPDCRMELRDGRKVAFQAQSTLHADGKPGPCCDHPGAMEAQKRFIRKLVEELGAHENVVVWNIWQEIGYWSENLAGGSVCYCKNTLDFFRRWLRELYEDDIQRLNSHWAARYDSFEAIEPDRCQRPVCIPQQFYFRYFMENVQIANLLRARYETIREADPLRRPIFAHKGGPEIGSGADWTYARTQDFLGTSNYPAWGSGSPWDDMQQTKRLDRHEALSDEVWDNLALRMDYLRSASRKGAPVWAAEYQGGPVSTDFHPGRIPDAADMRRWMLTTMGAGATALSFWVTRAEIMAPETNGFALLDSLGDGTERLEEAARIGRALQKHPDLFARNNKQPAKIAIMVDEWNYQLLQTMQFVPQAYVYDVRGWYKTLWSAGIPADFLEASRLSGDTAYQALAVPMGISMSDKVAQGLLCYARQGGELILEGGCGRLNEAALAPRGELNPILREELGITVQRFALVREPGEEDRWSQPERTWGEYEQAGFMQGCGCLEGMRIRANVFVETYAGAGEETVIWRWNGRPAGIRKAVGNGHIWLVGTALGFNGTAYTDTDSQQAARRLLAECGIVSGHAGKLLLQKRVEEKREAWFITNPTREAAEEFFETPAGAGVSDLLGEPLQQTDKGFRVCVPPLDVRVVLLEK